MHPVTQMLRAFTWPDQYERKPRKDGRSRERDGGSSKSPFEQQLDDLNAVREALGPEARPWFGPAIVLDAETHTGVSQPLRYGVAQIRGWNYRNLVEFAKKYKGKVPRSIMDEKRREILFHEPAQCTDDEIVLMREYADRHNMVFVTRADFVAKEYYKLYYIKSGKNGELPETLPAMIIGHSLPFDLGTLAFRAGPSRGDNYGGLTLYLQKKRPGLAIRKIGFGKHFYKAHQSRNERRNHRFIDTMQLGRALLGASVGGSLNAIAKALGIKEIVKGKIDFETPITDDKLDYCRNDVELTWQVYVRLRELYNRHGFPTPIHEIYSEASVGKAYLSELGITPALQKSPGLKAYCGIFMEAMYGGRSEVRWRHEIREGMQADFKSQYASVNTLMGLQRFNIARNVTVSVGGASSDVTHFLRTVTLEDLFKRETWLKLAGVAMIKPSDGDILPVRTVYEKEINQDDMPSILRVQQIGDNEIESAPACIYSFADIIASKIRTGRLPRIISTYSLVAESVQDGLKPVNFFGEAEYNIDLTQRDLFQTIIEMRGDIKRKLKTDFKGSSTHKAMEKALKLTASASSYGSLVEFNVDERQKETGTTVYYGTTKTRKTARKVQASDDGGGEISGYKVEKPGKWFAPWGVLIPAGGRLLLAMAEQLAAGRRIHHGFCDTDSMFFIRPDGMDREEFQKHVREITGSFQALNPYTGGDPLFNLEDTNYRLQPGGRVGPEFEPLYFFGVSAKRYVLANQTEQGEWIVRKASGHGLAHITAPHYESNLPHHPAAPFEIEEDDTSPLWFGVKGVWKEGELCHGGNPRLFCDLWRLALETAQAYSGGRVDFETYLDNEIDEIASKMTGLDKNQMLQRSLSSRDEWLSFPNLELRRPFMFFNTIPQPLGVFLGQRNPQIDKIRDDLNKTTFYTSGGANARILPLAKYQVKGKGKEGLYRRDNNQFPAEMFDEKTYCLHFQTIPEALYGYFTHAETKSRGQRGYLKRIRLTIFDHEYIGKETNSLIDQVVDEADDLGEEELPVVRIFRGRINVDLLRNFGTQDISDALGISEATVYNHLFKGSRFKDDIMKRLRASIVTDERGRSRLMPLPPTNARKQRDRKLRRQLQTLHDALAKGKDFDLNGPRRSALKNVKRGPVPLLELVERIKPHVPSEGAKAALSDEVKRLWFGKPTIRHKHSSAIESAIALASGAERAAAKRVKRKEAIPEEQRSGRRANQQKVARTKRKAEVETVEFRTGPSHVTTFISEDTPVFEDTAVIADAEMPMEFDLFISNPGTTPGGETLMHVNREPEVASALRATSRRASRETAPSVFHESLQTAIGQREKRLEQKRAVARRAYSRSRTSRGTRRTDEANHPINSGVKNAPAQSRISDDDTQQIVSKPDRSVISPDEIV